MPNGPKCYLVLDTGNRYSPSMTLRFIKTSPFKYLKVARIWFFKVKVARSCIRVRGSSIRESYMFRFFTLCIKGTLYNLRAQTQDSQHNT